MDIYHQHLYSGICFSLFNRMVQNFVKMKGENIKKKSLVSKGSFDNVILVTLFVFFRNLCG